MHQLGFKYETRSKHFYVDNHEKPEVKWYRDVGYVPRYLDREFRQHRWVQLLIEEAEKMIADGEIGEAQGLRFERDGKWYIEYHVDHHPTFQHLGAEKHQFGGLLSVRMPEGVLPVIVLGQDEAIFKQFLSWWKAWSGPGGLKALWPKDDGLAVMISAIVSRKLGFGVEWSSDLQKEFNQFREVKEYSNKE